MKRFTSHTLEAFKVGRKVHIVWADCQSKAAQHLGEFGVITKLVDSKGFYTVKLDSDTIIRCRYSYMM